MRAFIAIELPPETKDVISKIQNKLKAALPKISWVKPVNIHLTLKFLGEISPKQLDNINQIVSAIVGTSASFKIKLETLGVFPNVARARIMWIGTDAMPPGLEKIVTLLENELGKIGFTKEKRPFCAHITVGRIKFYLNPSNLEKVFNEVKKDILSKDLEFNVAGITIFQSTLGSTGPTYKVLKADNFKII